MTSGSSEAASVVFQLLFNIIGSNKFNHVWTHGTSFDAAFHADLNSIAMTQTLKRQSKFFEPGSVLITDNLDFQVDIYYHFAIIFQNDLEEFQQLPGHENYLLEVSENGYWLSLHCLNEEPVTKFAFWNKETWTWKAGQERPPKCEKRFGKRKNSLDVSIVGFAPYTIYDHNKANRKLLGINNRVPVGYFKNSGT